MNRKQSHSIDIVFVLVLFCTFAVAVLMVLMVGAGSYNSVTVNMDRNYEDRTGVAYIAEKVRHWDECEDKTGISVGEFAGENALFLSQIIEGVEYVTYIYYYDGSIRELFTEAGNDLPPESGEIIINAAGFKAEMLAENLLKATCSMESGNEPYILGSLTLNFIKNPYEH